MLSNPDSNHPVEQLRTSDGLQTADPLAVFPSESATEQRARGTQSHSVASRRDTENRISAGNEAVPLLAFVSEDTVSRDAALEGGGASSKASFELFRPLRVGAGRGWALLRRAVHYAWLVTAFIVGVPRNAWLLVVRAARGCFITMRRLFAASRAQFTVVRSMLLHTIARLRDATTHARGVTTRLREAGLGVGDASGIVKAELTGLWRALCSRTSIVVNGLRRQRDRVLARRAASPAPMRFRQRVVQLHPWTYPVGLFVSGVALGASLVTFARTAAYESVPAVAAVVAANQTHVAVSTNDARVPSAPLTDLAPTAPRSSESPSAPARRPVQTGGVGPSVRRPAVPRRQVVPADTPPGPRQAFRGSLDITSRPGGAAVYLNGRRVGATPLVLENLPIGSRAVRLTLDGYQPWTSSVQVSAERRTAVRAALQTSRSR